MNESWHGQGRDCQPCPQPSARQITAFGQPGQRQRQRDDDGDGAYFQRQRIDQQLAHAGPEHHGDSGMPAGLHGGPQDKAER